MVNYKLRVFIIISICAFALSVSSFASETEKVEFYFTQGDYHNAIAEGERILGGNIDKQHSDQLYYLLGLSYLKEGNLLRASDIFSIMLNEFKDTRFREEASFALADTYFLEGDLDRAEKYYQDLLKNNPSTKFKAQVYSRLSEIGFKKGDTAAGKAYADKLKLEFPLNPEALSNNDISLTQSKNEVLYSAQVGSFSNSVNANNLMAILIKKGYPAFVEEGVSANNDKIYRVKVGKFSNRKEASKVNDQLIREGYPAKICP